jgi:hypothetical protein
VLHEQDGAVTKAQAAFLRGHAARMSGAERHRMMHDVQTHRGQPLRASARKRDRPIEAGGIS